MEGRSGIGWLSSSSAEIARARDVLKSLTPGGVIDELGFRILQGAFADQFYPAVTTPMTRARYLVFVSAIYQHLERSGNAVGGDADRPVRRLLCFLQRACACVWRLSESQASEVADDGDYLDCPGDAGRRSDTLWRNGGRHGKRSSAIPGVESRVADVSTRLAYTRHQVRTSRTPNRKRTEAPLRGCNQCSICVC